jgi:hypothetical protein
VLGVHTSQQTNKEAIKHTCCCCALMGQCTVQGLGMLEGAGIPQVPGVNCCAPSTTR